MMSFQNNADQELVLSWEQSPWIGYALCAFGSVFLIVGGIVWLGYTRVINVPADADWMLLIAGFAFPTAGAGIIFMATHAMTHNAQFVFDRRKGQMTLDEQAILRTTHRLIDFSDIAEVVVAKSIHHDMEGIGSIELKLQSGKKLSLISQWSMEQEIPVAESIAAMVGVELSTPFS